MQPVNKLAQKIYELDVLLAFAIAAQEHNLCCPTLTVDPTQPLVIEDGRHLLQGFVVKFVVRAFVFGAQHASLG